MGSGEKIHLEEFNQLLGRPSEAKYEGSYGEMAVFTESNETSLTHERPTRPISKARALGRETGSTFCSRGPDRQLAYHPSEGDSLQTEVRKFWA